MSNSGFDLDDHQVELFTLYGNELRKWNRRINLTSVTDDQGVILKHFVDSLWPLKHDLISLDSRVIDVGTGAGFPGLPLKILVPSLDMTLVDSSYKKVSFLKHLVIQMHLSGVSAMNKRGEEMAEDSLFMYSFDYVTTRYVAELSSSASYCLKLLRPGGVFIAYKGGDPYTEIENSMESLSRLGGRLVDCIEISMHRSLVIIERMGRG
jgi:16S rRNA (guanine527-N7)-methyltransferase